MIGNLGIDFSPLANPSGQGQQNGNGQNQPGSVPISDAIQTLALRLPRIAGARGLAPDALMNGGGMGGLSPDLMAMLRQLLGQFSLQQPSMTGAQTGGQTGQTSPYSSPTSPYASQMPYSGGGMSTPQTTSFPTPSVTPGSQDGPVGTGDLIDTTTQPSAPTYDANSFVNSQPYYDTNNPYGGNYGY